MKSILVILRRVYLGITGNHCAAKLIEYFKHWHSWKLKHHRPDWIYMPFFPDPGWDYYELWGYVVKADEELVVLLADLNQRDVANNKARSEVRSRLEAISSVQLKI